MMVESIFLLRTSSHLSRDRLNDVATPQTIFLLLTSILLFVLQLTTPVLASGDLGPRPADLFADPANDPYNLLRYVANNTLTTISVILASSPSPSFFRCGSGEDGGCGPCLAVKWLTPSVLLSASNYTRIPRILRRSKSNIC
ncbi:hypothetical protein OF83DRAFT_919401 [Amylostereum chailletii]|nr:hypothetical protein OF83DRAFT_919401 [Amylostereum chailletii]